MATATLPIVMKISTVADGSAEKILSLIEKDAKKLETASAQATRQMLSLQKAMAGVSGNLKGLSESADLVKQSEAAAKSAAKVVVDAEQKKQAARAEARANLEFALREEEKYRVAVAAASRKQEQAAKEASQATVKAAQEAERATERLKGLGASAALGLAAAGAAMGALALSVVNTAREFEAYEATLKTVLGTSLKAAEKIAEAKKYAAETPFDVKGVVAATVQLEVYGQKSKEILPRVAALAAGMGKSLDETALAVGKALSGSLEGFESLRNTYGITTRELVRFGAEASKAGGVLVNTASQADKAREALLKIIDIRFGEALANRSETVDAAISNAGDSITAFTADVGQAIAPLVKLGAVLTGQVFEALQRIPGPMKAIAGTALLVGAGVATITGASGLAALGLFALDAELKKVATSNAAVAATSQATTGALNLMGGAASRTAAAMRWMTTNPYGIALTAVAAATTAAYAATQRYVSIQKELQTQMREESNLLQGEIRLYRDLIDKINEKIAVKNKEKGITVTDDVGQTRRETSSALDDLPADDLRKVLSELRLTYEELGKQEAEFSQRVADRESTLATLIARRTELENKAALGQFALNTTEASELRTIQEKIDKETQLRSEAKARHEVVRQIAEETKKQNVAIEGVAKAAEQAGDFLKFNKGDDGLKGLSTNLSVIQEKLQQAGAAMKELNIPLDRDSLVNKLREGVEDDGVKQAITSYIDLLDERKSAEEGLQKKRAELGKASLDELERNFAKEKAMRDVSYQEELKSLQDRLAIARSLGQDGIQQETTILNAIKTLREGHEREVLNNLKNSFAEQVKASQQFIQQLNAQGKPSSEVEAAYDRVIAKVKAWQASHSGVISANKELRQQVQQTLASLITGKEQAATKQLAENFQALQLQIRQFGSEAQTSGQKLSAVERSIALVKQAQAKGSIETAKADQTLADLARQRLGLEQTISQEKLRQAGEVQQLEIAGIQQEIDWLELKLQAGINVTNELIAKRQQLHEARLKALDLEKQAEQETADDKLAIEEKYQLKIRNLERERTLDLQRENVKRIQETLKPSGGGQRPFGGSGGSEPRPEVSGPGAISTNNAYRSGIGSSGFGTRDEYLERRSSGADADQQRRNAFEMANPGVMDRVRSIDAERARKIAEASANKTLLQPYGSERAASVTRGYDTVTDEQRKRLSGATGQAKPEPKNQTVNDNRSFEVAINVEGGESADIQASPALERIIISTVERQMRIAGYYDGGQGPVV